jgi:hypothetical protein
LKTLLFSKFATLLGVDESGSAVDNINKGIVQCPQEIAMRELAEKRGETFLSFMNFWRTGISFSWDRQRTSVARRGFYVTIDDDKLETTQVKAVPVDIQYDVWLWSKDLDKIYQCIEKYMFWQQDNPNMSITYDSLYTLGLDLHFDEVVDESTVEEKYESGIMFVYRFPIKIDAWIFEDSNVAAINRIVLNLYDKDEVSDYLEIIVADSNQNTELQAALQMFRKKLYGILSVDSANKTIIVPGNFASDFSVSQSIIWENSTDNDEVYTIVSATDTNDTTVIVVAEEPVSDTADGNLVNNA